jgi:hypothetical protein
MIGISIADGGFELICGDRIGRRRYLDQTTLADLAGYASRYADVLERAEPSAELLELGLDLYRFLEGEGGHLTALIDRAPRPLHFGFFHRDAPTLGGGACAGAGALGAAGEGSDLPGFRYDAGLQAVREQPVH